MGTGAELNGKTPVSRHKTLDSNPGLSRKTKSRNKEKASAVHMREQEAAGCICVPPTGTDPGSDRAALPYPFTMAMTLAVASVGGCGIS